MQQQKQVINDILAERQRQNEKWGVQSHSNPYWHLILGEEVGEVANTILEGEGDERLYQELIQVAAVATQWCERILEKGILEH